MTRPTARRVVVDTSAWIEWLTTSRIGKALADDFPGRDHCLMPTIVQLELSKWLMREVGEERADAVIGYTNKCVVIPLDTTIALLAAVLHREHKLATADAIVYATARQHEAELLTCDRHFNGLTGVSFHPKTPAEN